MATTTTITLTETQLGDLRSGLLRSIKADRELYQAGATFGLFLARKESLLRELNTALETFETVATDGEA